MREVILAVFLASGCSSKSTDAEIARLKAELAAAQASRPPSIATVTPTQEPVTEKTEKAPATGDLAGFDEAPSEMTGDWLSKLATKAAENRKTITYAHLKKNADKYATRAWSFTGQILEITEEKKEGVTFSEGRMKLDFYGNQVVSFVAPFSTDFVENNIVDVAGFLSGNYSYESQAGWNITIPQIVARSITKRGTLTKLTPKSKRRRSEDE